MDKTYHYKGSPWKLRGGGGSGTKSKITVNGVYIGHVVYPWMGQGQTAPAYEALPKGHVIPLEPTATQPKSPISRMYFPTAHDAISALIEWAVSKNLVKPLEEEES